MRLATAPRRRTAARLALASAVLVSALQILLADMARRSRTPGPSLDAGAVAGRRN